MKKSRRVRPSMANRTLSWFRLFCIGRSSASILSVNPCAGDQAAGHERPRERVLDDSELLAVWRAAEGIGGAGGRMAQLLVLTGQRLREVAQLEWRELDLDAAIWTLPSSRAKNDRAHEIPLAPLPSGS